MNSFSTISITNEDDNNCLSALSIPSTSSYNEDFEKSNKESLSNENYNENEVCQRRAKSSPMLPSIFVKIPLYINQQYQNKQKSDEIKSEPIKSEIYEQQNLVNNSLSTLSIDKNSDVSTSSIRSATTTPDENTTVIPTPPLPVLLNIANENDINNNINANKVQCLKCLSCPYLTLNQEILNLHVQQMHHVSSTTAAISNLQVFSCPGCANLFHSINVLKVHLELDHLMLQNEIEVIANNYNNIVPSRNANPKSRIYIKNVQLLKKPDLIQQNSFSNNIITNTSERKKSKFFIKNIQLLRKPDYVQSANTTNLFDEINSQANSDYSDDLLHPLPSSSEEMSLGTDISNGIGQTYPQNMSDLHESQYSFTVPTEQIDINYNEANNLNEYAPPDEQYNMNELFEENNFNLNNMNINLAYANEEKMQIVSDDNSYYYNDEILTIDEAIDTTTVISPMPLTTMECTKPQVPTIHLKSVDELNLMTFDQLHNINAQQQTTVVCSNPNGESEEMSMLLDNNEAISCDNFGHIHNDLNATDNQHTFNGLSVLNTQGVESINMESSKLGINGSSTQYFSNDFIIIPPTPESHTHLHHLTYDNHPQNSLLYVDEQSYDPDLECELQQKLSNSHSQEDTDEDTRFVCAEEIINDKNMDVKLPVANLEDSEKIIKVKNSLISNSHQLIEESNMNIPITVLPSTAVPVMVTPEKEVSMRTTSPKKPRLKKRFKQNDNSHKCMYSCGMAFRNSDKMTYHLKCHRDAKQPLHIICPECYAIDFKNWNTLHSHLWRFHNIDMELFSCNICSFKTPSWSILNNTHIKIHSNERKFKCELCDLAFKNTKQLKNHRNRHRPKKLDEEVNCDVCGKALKNSRLLKQHVKKKHPLPEAIPGAQQKSVTAKSIEKFPCKVCDKTFESKISLRHHSLTHVEEKRFKCAHCEYTTNDHNSYRRHKMRYDEKKMYKCSFCKYRSIQSTSYRIHLEKQHPDDAAHLFFKCSHCTFISINKDKYDTHVQKHLNAHSDIVSTVTSPRTKSPAATITSIDFGTTPGPGATPTNNADDTQRKKIKVKSNLVLTDPSKLKNLSENSFLQNLLPNQILDTNKVTTLAKDVVQHQPFIRPALFANNFSKVDNLHSPQNVKDHKGVNS